MRFSDSLVDCIGTSGASQMHACVPAHWARPRSMQAQTGSCGPEDLLKGEEGRSNAGWFRSLPLSADHPSHTCITPAPFPPHIPCFENG